MPNYESCGIEDNMAGEIEPRQSSEQETKEPQSVFVFRDQYCTHEMPVGLKELADNQFKKFKRIVEYYLTVLHNVTLGQKADYKGKNTELLSELLSENYKGEKGMSSFFDKRRRLLDKIGRDALLELESYMKVDSQGVEGGDERPLLGVDKSVVIALGHYMAKSSGYEEIGVKE